MGPLNVRVTTLEEFRRVVATPWGVENDLINYVRNGQSKKGNWQMDRGTAWHAILADPVGTWKIDEDEGESFHKSGQYAFGEEDVQDAVQFVGPGQFELEASARLRVDGLDVKVTGHADHLWGLSIQDNKAKSKTPDLGDYEGSLQWRWYLRLFESRVFRYNLWHFTNPTRYGYSRLLNVAFGNFWAYAGMNADLDFWLSEFICWAGDRNLLPYLAGRRPSY